MNARTKTADTTAGEASGAESAAQTSTDTSAATETDASDAPIGDAVAGIPVDDGGYANPIEPAAPASEPTVEAMIVGAGLTGPRVTIEKIAKEISSEFYFTPMDAARALGVDSVFPSSTPMARLTFCVLVLKNGFTVTGQSACVAPENFNEEIGKRIARDNAIDQVWPLLGFRLADRIHHNLPLD